MRVASAPEILDDLPLEPLLAAVENEIRFLEDQSSLRPFIFGPRAVSKADYLKGLKRFVELGRTSPSVEHFYASVRENFDFYEVYGDKEWGDVFITSYFEPWIKGSTRRKAPYTQPLYRAPDDLVSLDLGEFDAKFSGERKLRGRIVGKKFVPYFNREEIDTRAALKGKRLEICWVDPIDAFFLHTQGSGMVSLDNGKTLRVNYADKNGHLYEQLSKYLKDKIPLEQMNMHTIEIFLRSLPPGELQKYLNLNPSYVFFQPLDQSALTYMGVPATDGRTIATDPKFFPKGALAFLMFDKPRFDDPASPLPSASEPSSRFVLDQDIGGAITGGGRLDLFWGRGEEAKRFAGAMKARGRLYYLVPK